MSYSYITSKETNRRWYMQAINNNIIDRIRAARCSVFSQQSQRINCLDIAAASGIVLNAALCQCK